MIFPTYANLESRTNDAQPRIMFTSGSLQPLGNRSFKLTQSYT
jgi:hypothetical protein